MPDSTPKVRELMKVWKEKFPNALAFVREHTEDLDDPTVRLGSDTLALVYSIMATVAYNNGRIIETLTNAILEQARSNESESPPCEFE